MSLERWSRTEGGETVVHLALSPSHVLQELEVRVPVEVPGREPVGCLTLFRPLDDNRILTDLTVIVDELRPALLRALETLARPATHVAGGNRSPRDIRHQAAFGEPIAPVLSPLRVPTRPSQP